STTYNEKHYYIFLLVPVRALWVLRSFPTRRSSDLERGQRGGRFLGRGVVDLAVAGVVVAQQQRVGIGRDFVHLDSHAVDHADDVFDLIRIDEVVGEVIVDFGVGQVALFKALDRKSTRLNSSHVK